MKRAIALSAALVAAACGGATGKITAEEARNAIPSQDQAKIDVPQISALTAAPRDSADTVAAAPFAMLTIALSGAVNLGVAAPLVLVRAVVDFQPTSCEGDTCTWGPGSSWHDLNEFKLTVTKVDDHYAWALSGRPRSASGGEFTKVLYGNAWPSGQRWVGHGDFTLDLDAAATGLDHFDDAATGKIVVSEYDNRSGQQKVAVQFLGMADDSNASQKVNAAYQYQNDSTGGDLQIATHNLSTDARLTIHSRWKPTGAGRGEAAFVNNPLTYDEAQCWDAAATRFALQYDSLGPSGDLALCVFQDSAPLTISAP